MFGLTPSHIIIVAVIAVLLFGKRLPEVGRSFGKQLIEFKKSLRGIEDVISSASSDVRRSTPATTSTRRNDYVEDREEATAPKFEPPPAEPRSEPVTSQPISAVPIAAEPQGTSAAT